MRIDISASRREQILAANQALIQAQKDIAIVGALVEGAGGNPGRKFTTAIDHDGEQWFLQIDFVEDVES